jgi:hypothetical protein
MSVVIERMRAPDWIEEFIKWNGGRLEEPTAEDLSASGSQTRAPTVERVATRGRGQTQHPSTKAEGARATGARESSANAQ